MGSQGPVLIDPRSYRPRAILSVTDKSGIVGFATGLAERGFELYSTGGTAAKLREAGLSVTDVADLTKFPEGMGGRVKTMHPMVAGGLLGRLDVEEHVEFQDKHEIEPFQLVVVNLYDFTGTVADPDVPFDDAIENVDIGGPTMIRSAAKNYRFCLPVVSPARYQEVLDQIDETEGPNFSEDFRRELQLEAFTMTANYDHAIMTWLTQQSERRLQTTG